MNCKLRNVLFASTLAFAGCSSSTGQAGKRSLNPQAAVLVEGNIPVETVDGYGGRFLQARVRAHGSHVHVAGSVTRSFGEPPPWAHIDVLVLDPNGKVVESVSTQYLPRAIPHPVGGGGTPGASFVAELGTPPPKGSTVRVIFHGERSCELRAS